MRLNIRQQSLFPKCHRYIATKLPDVLYIPKIVFALQKHGGYTVDDFGVTILHELVHWNYLMRGIWLSHEEGETFEIEAYGDIIPC